MDFHLRIKIDYKMPIYLTVIFLKKTIFSRKLTLQIGNSGIVKTCDEHVHGPFYDCVVCPVTKQIGQNHSGMNGIDRNIFVLMWEQQNYGLLFHLQKNQQYFCKNFCSSL